MALIQYPKLATMQEFDLVKTDSKFSFLKDIKGFYIDNPEISASIILEKIANENVKNIFGEALVSEIKLSKEDALSMIKDCLELITKSEAEREEILKEKYNMQELTSSEKRELQQIILKKDKMSQEETALIKDLSSN